MLIRKQQLDAFEKDRRRRFYERLSVMFREHLTRQTEELDNQELLLRMEAADLKARSYGIVGEQGVAQFAALTFIAGPRFDERPKTQRYLTYPRIEPHHKIATLYDCLVERQRGRRPGGS